MEVGSPSEDGGDMDRGGGARWAARKAVLGSSFGD